jgi:3-hydroxyacyl-CoA dehydrogenase
MALRSFKKIGVLGMGLMGNGIAQITAAVANLPVVAYDVSPDAAAKGRAAISKSLRALTAKQVAKGALDAAGAEAYLARAEGNLTTATDLGALRDCDIVIEAAPESWELKRKLYSGLAAHLAPAAVLASNTSGLLIEDLAREFGHPERVVGLHFFNPVPIMALCEVISTPHTAPAVTEAVTALVRAQGKTPVQCKDSPGFVVNRLLVPFLAQAIRLHSEGVASTADIDAAMRLGCGHPMGPLQLADYVGLDTTLFILKNWTAKYPGEPAFLCVASEQRAGCARATHTAQDTPLLTPPRPHASPPATPPAPCCSIPQALVDMVAKGHLGRKSGRGFYSWAGDKVGAPC